MAESVAEMLLGAAHEDAKAMRALSDLPDISDARYGLIDPGTLDRKLACEQVHSVLHWAGLQVKRQ